MSASANSPSTNAATSAQPNTGQPQANYIKSHLTRRQILALPILAAAPNTTEAARESGISESTLRRWRRNEHFRSELERLTSETADLTRQLLESLTRQSGQVLSDLMQDPDPMVRLRAARAVAVHGNPRDRRRHPAQEHQS